MDVAGVCVVFCGGVLPAELVSVAEEVVLADVAVGEANPYRDDKRKAKAMDAKGAKVRKGKVR